MSYLLDTNTCIYYMNGSHESVKEMLLSLDEDDLFISSITVTELMYGVFNSQRKKENYLALIKFLGQLNLVDFDSNAAIVYGQIRSKLKNDGCLIGPNDLFIAAHALSLGMTLVTNNEKEFKRVDGLRIANWLS